ncbi:ABC transporter ATP-binding protein [Paenibacillus sp. TAB 01]|uniref:ABC transporter ATP-binding protein n=1 Tax=Paenibacillus sp. TAB 01 TaxID=3368988 RepID=UPI003753A074
MDKSVLSLKQVTKRIQKQQIIHSVNFNLSHGQALALCGGNGAGKSTILRMIAGILQPSSGSIEVNGVSWKQDRKGYAEQIGYMPDDYRFGQGLSAEETLAFWGSLRKVSKDRLQEILYMVGLYEVRMKSVSSFSKGMRQRLLFAQALLTKPPLLIMDEPTNGLDPYWLESFIALVASAKLAGHTIIFSTHQLEIAEAVADHVIFLKEGRVMEEGTISDFRQSYESHGLQSAFHRLFGFPSYSQPNGGEFDE